MNDGCCCCALGVFHNMHDHRTATHGLLLLLFFGGFAAAETFRLLPAAYKAKARAVTFSKWW